MDLVRHELVPRGRLDHQTPPLSWDYLDARPEDLAIITCDRGHVSRMVSRVHRIAADGRVSPSYVCPIPGCRFHAFIRLVGYEQQEGKS